MLFEAHPDASSSIGNHHFYNTKCTSCDANALGHYDSALQSHLGYTGGCGNIACSGRSNYIMYDHDGTLFGTKGVIIPNNPTIGDNTPDCVFNTAINGHVCTRSDFARLKYTSISSDFDTRITWPVSLTPEGGNYTTVTNGWREWSWNANEPLNRRKGRFLSIVQLSKYYNMSFNSQPPTDLLFSFSLPTEAGDNTQWIGIKMYYPVPNAIAVAHSNGSTTTTILASDSKNINDYVTSCGANKYLYKDNIVHFIVTADASCSVRVTLTSSVQIKATLSINITDFNSGNGLATFVEQMANYLAVASNRIRIVGVYEGSTIVDAVIVPPPVSTENAGTVVPDSAAIVDELRALSTKVSAATAANLPGLPSFIGATSTVNVMNVNG